MTAVQTTIHTTRNIPIPGSGGNLQKKQLLGQYFTPQALAAYMVSLIKHPKRAHVVEPSSGKGIFLSELSAAGFENTTAIEIDSRLGRPYDAISASFLSWEAHRPVEVIIGNPPYIRWKNMTEAQQSEMIAMNEWDTILNPHTDYLSAFIVHAVDILAPGGELLFVTPSYWTRTMHAQPLRDLLINSGYVSDLILFGETKIFSNVSTETIVFRWVKHKINHIPIVLRRYVGPRILPSGIDPTIHFELEEIPQFTLGCSWHHPEKRLLEASQNLESWCGHQSVGTLLPEITHIDTLGEIADIANGMVTGLESAFRLNDNLRRQIPVAEQSGTILVAKASGIDALRVRELTCYIDLPDGSEPELRRNYPFLMSLLDNHIENLKGRYQYAPDQPYWAWSFKRSLKFFTDQRKKIIVPCKERMTNRVNARFSMLPSNAVATQDVTAIALKSELGIREEPEYVCAYLNLPLVSDWYRAYGLMKGGIAEFSEFPLSRIPIRRINFDLKSERDAHDSIVSLVQQANSVAKADSIEQLAERIWEQFKTLGLPSQGREA